MSAEAEPAGGGGVRTLVRGLTILELVAKSPGGASVTDLAAAADLDKGTTSRLLTTLRNLGYVRQRPGDRHYLLSGRLLTLALAYHSQLDLRETARPHLVRLRDTTHETVHLAVREGDDIIYVDQLEPDRSVRIRSSVGRALPMHRTAMGRAIMAALPAEECEAAIARVGEGEPADTDEIREGVRLARERGWATIDRNDDVTRVGAAILDATGEPIGAITVSGPSYRMTDRMTEWAAACVDTAHEIGRDLGATH
jgi:IclR family acetate operon transcriptional repressor